MTENNTLEISRRRLLGTVGAAGAAGLVIGAAGGVGVTTAGSDGGTTDGAGTDGTPALTTVGSTQVMFHGKHQAGITTPSQ
ncbi:iron uptake transporter deferrochelatase/peroxidase subunit, partial [Streptomyces massasporeus]